MRSLLAVPLRWLVFAHGGELMLILTFCCHCALHGLLEGQMAPFKIVPAAALVVTGKTWSQNFGKSSLSLCNLSGNKIIESSKSLSQAKHDHKTHKSSLSLCNLAGIKITFRVNFFSQLWALRANSQAQIQDWNQSEMVIMPYNELLKSNNFMWHFI